MFCETDKAIKELKECNLKERPHYYCRNKCRPKNSNKKIFCSACFNEKYIKDVCDFYSSDSSKSVPIAALCPVHAYSEIYGIVKRKKIQAFSNCNNCKLNLKSLCYICIKYFEKSDLKIMHEFHSICNRCYEKNKISLPCHKCRSDEGNKTITTAIEKCNYFGRTDINHNSEIQRHNLMPSKQPNPVYNQTNQEYPDQVYSNYGSEYFCQEHGQRTNYTLVCKIHIGCEFCIFKNIINKFHRFVYAIESKDIEWLQKFHRYGCYNSNCLFADFSFSLNYFKPYLNDHISTNYPNYLGLLHYFIQYAEGFILNFKLCQCGKAVTLHPYQMCDSCSQNNRRSIDYGGNLSQFS